MKTTTLAISIAFMCFAGFAQAGESNPLAQHLIPPRLALQHAEKIGLTDEQRITVQAAGEFAHREAQNKQLALHEALEALRVVLQKDKIDESAARAGLDKVLDAERALKHVHLRLLITVTNTLTVSQRGTLRTLRGKMTKNSDHAELEARLKAKLARVQRGVEAFSQRGEDPHEVVELMERFTGLMRRGEHEEAESLLDQALDWFRRHPSEKPAADDDKEASSNEPPAPPASFLSPEAMKSQIASMRVEDVAWRKIAWKTCLLDALAASRAQKKPLIVWVFIDRPVDDKRC